MYAVDHRMQRQWPLEQFSQWTVDFTLTSANSIVMICSPVTASIEIIEIAFLWALCFSGCLFLLVFTTYLGYLAACAAESIQSRKGWQKIFLKKAREIATASTLV